MMTSGKSLAVPMRANHLIFLLALAHLVLAVLYSGVTPYREAGVVLNSGHPVPVPDYGAPDERQHANYVQHLLDGKGFPIFAPGGPAAGERYEDHQPPLFYLLDAAWCKISGVSDATLPASSRCRLLNALIGAGTVIGVFYLAVWGLGRSDLGLAAAAFVAFLPMMASLSGTLSNDPLLFCLCTWILALLARQIRDGWSWRTSIVVGVLGGLALLTKTTAVGVLPAIALAPFLSAKTKPKLILPATALLVALLVVSPWWVRNQSLYGDPLALNAFNRAFLGSPKSQDLIAAMGAQTFWVKMFGWWTIRSFFGVFGYMDIFMNATGSPYMGARDPNTLYLCLFLATFFSALAGLRAAFQPSAKTEQPVHLLNLAFFVIVLVLYLRFNLLYFQAQARYLFPAIGPIAVAIGYGLCSTFKKATWVPVLAISIVLIGVNVYVLNRLPNDFALRSMVLRSEAPTIAPSTGSSSP